MKGFIKNHILDSQNKMISYADFIDLALYHPELGYYMKEGTKIGREGDFYTTSNISDIYGTQMAKWFSEVVGKFGIPACVCEIGAGTGRFAQAFLKEWKKQMSIPLTYILVEGSPYHRQLQRERVEMGNHVKQVKNINEVEPFEGLLFSNELFDALPVHVIQKKANRLFEIMVTFEDDKLVERLVPLENKRILNYLHDQQIELSEEQRLEIPIVMTDLIDSLSNVLIKGIAVTVDYGYTNAEWMEPGRRNGSLRGYYKHQMVDDVLLQPGEMDITSHVHLDSLVKLGEKAGLSFIDMLRQDEFLLAIGILQELQNHYDTNPFSEISKRNRAIRSLIMPSEMSGFFSVILQHKGLPNFSTEWQGMITK